MPRTLLLTALLLTPAQALPLIPTPSAKAATPAPQLLPAPQQAEYPPGSLPLNNLSVQLRGNAPELKWAGRDLKEAWRERLNADLAGSGTTPIVIGTIQDADLAQKAKEKGLLTDKPEGYALWVDATGAYVVGANPLGAYHGAQTLRQLLTPQGLRFANIQDFPLLKTRMAMIYLDQYSQGVNDKLIPLLAQLKYNSVLVVSNYVQWDTAKQLGFAHPGGASKAEAARVANLAREHGLSPVPLIETLGHTGWLFYKGANQDLVQDPGSQNPFAYDTLNPRTYQVVEGVLAEAVDTFKPKYVHIGHDEVRNVDRFPARENGKAVGFEKLFVDDTLRLHDFLKARNVGTMIWHDVAFADAFKDQIPKALPKDIVVAYWNYAPGADYPLLKEISKAGFPTLAAPWRDPLNPETFAKSALKYGADGLLQARWSGYFGNPSIWDGQADQGVAYLRGGNAAWNPAAPSVEAPAARYRDLYQPESYAPQAGELVDLSAVTNRKLSDPDEKGWIEKGPDTDLSALPTGTVKLGAYTFLVSGAVMTRGSRAAVKDLPEKVTLDLGQGVKADAIAFLHTTGWGSPTPREEIGHYEIRYADGSTLRQPLEYGRHIRAWTEPSATSMVQAPVWNGQTKDGLDVALSVLEWHNPKPNQVIKSVTLVSEGGAANPTLLGLTLLGSRK